MFHIWFPFRCWHASLLSKNGLHIRWAIYVKVIRILNYVYILIYRILLYVKKGAWLLIRIQQRWSIMLDPESYKRDL